MFQLSISELGKVLFSGEAKSLYAPGAEGDLTVLPRHADLITSLRPGTMRVKTAKETLEFPIEKGFLEVSDNEAFVLL